MDPDRWVRWHEGYADPGSYLSHRLAAVQGEIRRALDDAGPGPIRALSLCAGTGQDLLGVLADHPRRRDVSARLIELDPRLAEAARQAAAGIGAGGLEVVEGDAGLTDAYAGAVPVDLLLLAGIFGNIPDADIERTARATAMLCSRGATVIWTRHRRPPDLTPTIRRWYAEAGAEEVTFVAPEEELFSVWVGRFRGEPAPLAVGERLFAFA